MHISIFSVQTRDEFVECQAEIRGTVLQEPFLLWYRFPLAMRTVEPLEVPAPISPKFAQALKRIQPIYYA